MDNVLNSSQETVPTPIPLRNATDFHNIDTLDAGDTYTLDTNESIEFNQSSNRELEKTVEALVRILNRRNVRIDYSAARLLVTKAWRDGDLNGYIIDKFYNLLEDNPTDYVSLTLTENLLHKIKSDAENGPIINLLPTGVVNVFHGSVREVWDVQQQKLVPDYKTPTLVPETSDFQAAALQRYQRCVQRLKQCKKIRWWSDKSVSRLYTNDVEVVRPVECAMGHPGRQSVIGVLRRENDHLDSRNTTEQKELKWYLSDTLQSIELDFSEFNAKNFGLFLHSNIVIITGEIDQDSKLKIKDIAHPPNEEDEIDIENITPGLFTDKRDNHDYLRATLLSCRTVVEGEQPRDVWLVFGRCHFDDGRVLTNINNILSLAIHWVFVVEKNISGIILTGEFFSQPYHDSLKNQYKEGFRDFYELINLCQENLRGIQDPGLRCIPKFPLASNMIGLEHFDFCDIILASNPARFESQQIIRSGVTLTTRFTVCRQDLIYDVLSGRLSLQSPYEIPEFPTRQELETTIPGLLAGQCHLYPVPFYYGNTLRIPVGYDFTLYLSPSPNAVIISDDTVPFITFWKERCWFGCPGSISKGQYLLYDMCSNAMEIKYAVSNQS